MTLRDYIKENLTIDIDGIVENIYETYFIEPTISVVTQEYKFLNLLLGENSKILWAKELNFGETKWVVCCINYVFKDSINRELGYLHLIYDSGELYHVKYMKNFDDITEISNECSEQYKNYIKNYLYLVQID